MSIKYLDSDPYYDQLPPNFKKATIDDFYVQDHLLIGKPYLIHSEINPNIYWAKRTKPGFMDYNEFYAFLERGRIYIYDN